MGDVLKIGNSEQNQYDGNLIWYQIYIQRFKNPGFKFDKIKWRSAYIKKLN